MLRMVEYLLFSNQHSVAEGKKADYLLYHNGKPIAVVKAKDNKHAVGVVFNKLWIMPKSLTWNLRTPVMVMLSWNMTLSQERNRNQIRGISRQKRNYTIVILHPKNYTSDELNIIETPFYYDAHNHEPRYYQRIAVDRTVEAIARRTTACTCRNGYRY